MKPTIEQCVELWREQDPFVMYPHQIYAYTLAALEKWGGGQAVPDVLFDGYAVLQALTEDARKRTSPNNVCDVLDAVVRLLCAAPAPQPMAAPAQADCSNRAMPDGIRRAQLDFDARREPRTERYCIRCQRDIRPGQPARVVRIVVDEPMVLHPDDAGDLGEEHLVGENCARVIGWEFTRPETNRT